MLIIGRHCTQAVAAVSWYRQSILFVAFLSIIPLLTIVKLAANRDPHNLWPHLIEVVLPRLAYDTVLLCFLVSLGVLVIGATTAWIVSIYRFPGCSFLKWFLMLPLSVPSYIVAFAYTDFLDHSGPVQTNLRAVFSWQSVHDYIFPEIRSVGGAAVVLSLVLYPYVYLLARTAFLNQGGSILDASRILGYGVSATFFNVALPLARPALFAGLAIALMETLSDFGTASLFALDTFTVGIYNIWLNMDSLSSAAQLSLILVMMIFTLISVERLSRGKRSFAIPSRQDRILEGIPLTNGRAILALFICFLPPFLGFVLPAFILAEGAWRALHISGASIMFWEDLVSTVTLAGSSAFVIVILGFFLAYGLRIDHSLWTTAVIRVTTLGYAVPGTVLAVGLIIPLAWVDNTLDILADSLWGLSTGLVFSGTIFSLILAYSVRFLALSVHSMESGFARVTTSMDEAARLLGYRPGSILWKVHLPMLKGSLLSGALLIFVDVAKELPATLLMRPFGLETLATRAFAFAVDEQFERAALPAFMILLAGAIPVALLSKLAAISPAALACSSLSSQKSRSMNSFLSKKFC